MRLKTCTATLLFLISAWSAPAQIYTISTFAGGGIPENIPGTSASLGHTLGVAVDKSGNVFFSNTEYFVVERWDATTGLLTVVAGNGTQGFGGDGGAATGAQLYAGGIAVDSAGNLYIADHTNNRIRKVSNGVITTIAGNGTSGFVGDNGPATAAELSRPNAITVDSAGNLYIADTGNNLIRKVSNGVITTVAGTGTAGFSGDGGPAASAQLNTPDGVAVDTAGNLYIADLNNQRVRKVSNGTIATVAGTGTSGFSGDGGAAVAAQLNAPYAVAVDQAGNLYIADADNNRVRKVSNGVISTIAGGGSVGSTADGVATGVATSVRLSSPQGVAVDTTGNVYISDTSNFRIYKLSNGVLTTIAGGGPIGDNGPATSADLNDPEGVALDSANNVYITDYANDRIRKISNGIITTVAGNGTFGFQGDGGPATSAELVGPGAAVALDSAGNLYIADYGDGRVREVSNGVIATVAGGGSSVGDNIPATSASVTPSAVAVDSAGNLYIGDGTRVRKVSNGIITTVAGNGTTGDSGDGGPATSAALSSTSSLILDPAGNLYIDDSFSQRIREVSNGIITTVAGSGHSSPLGDDGLATSAGLDPYGIALDRGGNLYIADASHYSIRKVSNGVITTIAGNGTQGFSGDGGPATSAEFLSPVAVAVDSAGNVYVADSGNNRIRLLTPGPAPAVTPGGVVPVDSTISVIQPGSWISIYASNLAGGTSVWNGDFPTSLGGVSVTIDGKPAYLWFVSPGQINLQVPDDTTTGTVAVVVNTPFGSATSTVTLAPYGPSLLLQSDGKHVLAIVATPGSPGNSGAGYDIIGPSRPVKAGEVLVLFGVGFGPTTPAVTAGQVVTGAAPTNSPVTVAIGSAQANAVFAGIVEAGMYQINVIVPSNTGGGDQALVAGVNGVTTPAGPVVSLP